MSIGLTHTISRKNFVITFLIVLAVCGISLGIALYLRKDTVYAQSSSARKEDWRAGNIITDATFTDENGLSVQQIQSFLDQKIGTCDVNGTGIAREYGSNLTRAQYAASRGWQGPPYTCLNLYHEIPKTTPGGDMPANNYSNPSAIPSGARSAAWIIKDAAERYDINPKVLLVKIATESVGPLTSDNWPLFSQYRYAMGARCPDSGPGGSANCDVAYAGFSIQMYEAARLLRWYLDSMDKPWWSYKKPYQTNNILWNVEPRGCGAANVHIENKATAALYTYTPYQPNQAALNNLYGTGDNCSAYGNRNFWRVYWDWFGPTRPVATIYTQTVSSIADASGNKAEVRFSLSQRPVAEVVLILATSNDSLVGFNTPTTLKIQPDDWNRPERNRVILHAKNNPSFDKSADVSLSIQQIGSPDINFSYIDPNSIGKPSILWQPKQAAVYRLFSQSLNRHVFASRANDISALTAQGFILEGPAFTTCAGDTSSLIRYRKDNQYRVVLAGSPTATSLTANGYVNDGALAGVSQALGTLPVYELYHPTMNNYIYTTNVNEAAAIVSQYGYENKGVAFRSCQTTLPNPVFRLYNATSKTHFYTTNASERTFAEQNGYVYEGVTHYSPVEGTTVYRLHHPTRKAHFYTTNASERTFAEQNGYVYEGVVFYVDNQTTFPEAKPVYRLFNTSSGKHFYTSSASERDSVKNQGYTYEGIVWYIR